MLKRLQLDVRNDWASADSDRPQGSIASSSRSPAADFVCRGEPVGDRKIRILIVTDPWPPVVSGLVRTYQTTIEHLTRLGHTVEVISPNQFFYVRWLGDIHLRLAVWPGRKVRRLIDQFRPDAIHLASEGPLGLAARRWCRAHRAPFTTSYTTKIPEYMQVHVRLPPSMVWPYLRWFHSESAGVMVATETLARELSSQRIHNTVLWSRGVDAELFRPQRKDILDAPRPIYLYVGRVSAEKNVTAFLDLDLAGTKYVVGDGPQLPQLKRKYPHVRFVGVKHGEELVKHYAAGDVVVFPSRTDTFGLVLLESLACGVPVAAFPVPGPLDVIGDSGVGVLDDDLALAAKKALLISPEYCRNYAEQFSWESVTRQFVENLHMISWPRASS